MVQILNKYTNRNYFILQPNCSRAVNESWTSWPKNYQFAVFVFR